jgi:hypothetical protein
MQFTVAACLILPMVMSTAIAIPFSCESLPVKARTSAAVDDLAAWQAVVDEYYAGSKYFPQD